MDADVKNDQWEEGLTNPGCEQFIPKSCDDRVGDGDGGQTKHK